MPRRLIILGAGISGLAMAWYLKKRYPLDEIIVLEKSNRCGGWIQTIHKEGFLFELGPHSCRPQGNGQQTLALIEELGIQSEVILPSVDAKTRFIYYEKALQPLPKSLFQIPFSPLMKGWLKALWKDLQTKPSLSTDESIASFFRRRLGNAWVERLIDPFTSGIYAGDCERLSLKSCFPKFKEWENEGSLVKGCFKKTPNQKTSVWIKALQKQAMFSFKNGMQTLPLALATHLKSLVRFNQTVVSIQNQQVTLLSGEVLKADYIISTLPLFSLAPLIVDYPKLKKHLNSINYTSVNVVNLGFDKNLSLKGFGYLVPSKEKTPLLGCIFDSLVFPEQGKNNQTRLTALIGGSHHLQVKQWSEKQSIDFVLEMLKQQIKINDLPLTSHFHQAYQAIPQYEIGYQEWKDQLNLLLKNYPLLLSGSALTGVSVNDCIANASEMQLL